MKNILPIVLFLAFVSIKCFAASACCPTSSGSAQAKMTLIQNGDILLIQADLNSQYLQLEKLGNDSQNIESVLQSQELIVLKENSFLKTKTVTEIEKKISRAQNKTTLTDKNEQYSYEKSYQGLHLNKQYRLDFSSLFKTFTELKSLQLTALIQNQQKEWTITARKPNINW